MDASILPVLHALDGEDEGGGGPASSIVGFSLSLSLACPCGVRFCLQEASSPGPLVKKYGKIFEAIAVSFVASVHCFHSRVACCVLPDPFTGRV